MMAAISWSWARGGRGRDTALGFAAGAAAGDGAAAAGDGVAAGDGAAAAAGGTPVAGLAVALGDVETGATAGPLGDGGGGAAVGGGDAGCNGGDGGGGATAGDGGGGAETAFAGWGAGSGADLAGASSEAGWRDAGSEGWSPPFSTLSAARTGGAATDSGVTTRGLSAGGSGVADAAGGATFGALVPAFGAPFGVPSIFACERDSFLSFGALSFPLMDRFLHGFVVKFPHRDFGVTPLRSARTRGARRIHCRDKDHRKQRSSLGRRRQQ